MRVLVFGAGGQVGRELQRLNGRGGHKVIGLTRCQADIRRYADVDAAVRDTGCDLVINAAAYTAVDRAESEPELAMAVNRDGAENLARVCARGNRPLVQISTDYVFDGSKLAAYLEDDPVDPVGVYGRSKQAGEGRVRAVLDQHLILRTSWVFAATGQNFVKTMLRLAETRPELRVVDDQRGCPTAASDLAAAILEIAGQLGAGRWGTYHYCGAGATTWFGFAKQIFARRAALTGAPAPQISPIATTDFPTAAARPANSVLNCDRFAAAFGLTPRPWRDGLTGVLRELSKG